jgi:DNA-binding PadR family transcriptional regulator
VTQPAHVAGQPQRPKIRPGGRQDLDGGGDNRYLIDNRYLGDAVQQEVVLAMLAKEPSHGYELRARLGEALGPLGDAMNAGQIYVTLGRLEKAGLVTCERSPGSPDRSDRKVYELTSAGQQRVADWLAEVSWPRPDLAEFHLKLVAAAAARLADPIAIVDAQRRELLRRLRDAQRAAMAEPERSDAALLLEGIVLRLQADLRWLEACETNWTVRRSTS